MYWNPHPVAFYLPIVGHPVAWYGILFATGFLASYCIALSVLKHRIGDEQRATVMMDRLTGYIVAGVIIGARLGHVFFYDWPHYASAPWKIVMVWEGGLASHIGVVGLILGVALHAFRYRDLSFLATLDVIAVSVGLAAGCIRLGNFINQEIVGTPTQLPWAVVFGALNDGIPRHPVQLYEALFYFVVFIIMYRCRHWHTPGRLTGLVLTLIFTFRVAIEMFKEQQSLLIDSTSPLLMGQYLSIPFVVVGMIFLFRPCRKIQVLV